MVSSCQLRPMSTRRMEARVKAMTPTADKYVAEMAPVSGNQIEDTA